MSGFNLDKRIQIYIDEWEEFFNGKPEKTYWKKFVNTKKIYNGDQNQIDAAIGQFVIRRLPEGGYTTDEIKSTTNYMVLHDCTKELNSIYENGKKLLDKIEKELLPDSVCSAACKRILCPKCTTLKEGVTKVLNHIAVIEGTPIYMISRYKLSTTGVNYLEEAKEFVKSRFQQIEHYTQELSMHQLQNESAKNIMMVNDSRRKQEEAKEKVRKKLKTSIELIRQITSLCISNEHKSTLDSAEREYEKIFNIFYEYESGATTLEPFGIMVAELDEQLLYKLNFLKSVYPDNVCVKLVKNKKRKN